MEGLVGLGEELFGYNRGGYFFDSKLSQECEYQEQDVRIKQFELYRDDVRDLMELTTGKMDSYLVPTLLLLACCTLLLVHGVLRGQVGIYREEAPSYLVWLCVVNLAQAFLYLFMSAWLAIHASVSAHSFGVRLLTQFVRLPVPDSRRLERARAYAEQYEAGGAAQLLRVPVLTASTPAHSSHDSELPDLRDMSPDVTALSHVRAYRELQANWQAHDAYARACLSLGTYTFLHSVSYYLIGVLVLENSSPGAAFACVVVLTALSWLLTKMDLHFSTYKFVFAALLLLLGPLLTCVAATLLSSKWKVLRDVHDLLVPIIFCLHALLIVSVALATRAEQISEDAGPSVALPTRFRMVLYLDVFGWLGDPTDKPPKAVRRAQKIQRQLNFPAHLLKALVDESRMLLRQIHRETDVWATDTNARDLPGLSEQLEALKRQVSHATKRLDAVVAAVAVEALEPDSESLEIWLRLVWSSGSRGMEYYSRPATGEAQLVAPDGVFISDLNSLRDRMLMLEERLDTLRRVTGQQSTLRRLKRTMARERDPPQPIVTPRGSIVYPPGRSASPSESSSDDSSWLPSDSGQPDPHPGQRLGRRRRRGKQARAPQVTAEMAQLNLEQETASLPASAQTFHPRRDGRRESKKPMGQVPWSVFLVASSVLVVIWLLGIGYYVCQGVLSLWHLLHRASGTGFLLEQSPRVQLSGAMVAEMLLTLDQSDELIASRFTCNMDHEVAMLAGRYKVYRFKLPQTPLGDWPLQLQAAQDVDHCLSLVPDFLASGISSISLHHSRARCELVVLSLDGGHAISCPLHCSSGRSAAGPQVVELHAFPGQPGWMAAGPLGDDGLWWAARASAGELLLSELRLEAHGGARGAFPTTLATVALNVPDAVLPHSGRVMAFSMAARSLQGMSSRGESDSAVWSLPNSHQWHAVCLVDSWVLALGRNNTQGAPYELWRFAQPAQIFLNPF